LNFNFEDQCWIWSRKLPVTLKINQTWHSKINRGERNNENKVGEGAIFREYMWTSFTDACFLSWTNSIFDYKLRTNKAENLQRVSISKLLYLKYETC